MMLARLTRITATGAMRTQEIVGQCAREPEVGQPFTIMNEEPINRENGENMRMVTTSRVMWTETRLGGGISFQTESGTDYLYEELEEA